MTPVLKFTILFIALLLLSNCRDSQTVASSTVKNYDREIIGSWSLKTVSGNSLDKLNIKSCKLDFSEDGKWTFSCVMTGQFEGMELKGDGTYKVNGKEFDYTAGENKGKSEIEIKDNLLGLSPDPIIKPNGGKVDVKTVYERVE